MHQAVAVKALPNYHLWLQFEDGLAGALDLSQWVGDGVFSAWKDEGFFKKVRVGEFGEIEWGNQIDLCPDSLYDDLSQQRAPHDA